MPRYFVELAYDGQGFHGWQLQPGAPTVQEAFNTNLSKVLGHPINVIGAGRTDTGVHAAFFVAHFDVPQPIANPQPLAYKLNRMLPHGIVVFRIYAVPDAWHARFDALARVYKYYLATARNPFARNYSYTFGVPLDVEAMNRAARVLLQHTDFTSFSKLHTQVKTNNCRVVHAQWQPWSDGWVFTIEADRFLRNMVRAIVGSLLLVGQGRLSVAGFDELILARDRSQAGMSAPAQGLFLYDIKYPEAYGVHNPGIWHTEHEEM